MKAKTMPVLLLFIFCVSYTVSGHSFNKQILKKKKRGGKGKCKKGGKITRRLELKK